MKNFLIFGVFLVLAFALGNDQPENLDKGEEQQGPPESQTFPEGDVPEECAAALNETGYPCFNISSENYPGQYPSIPRTWVIKTENHTGFEIFVKHMNIDPFKDQLQIYYGDVSNVDADPQVRLTGKHEGSPMKFKVTDQPIITIKFVPQLADPSETTFDGFLLYYIYHGEIPKVPEPPETDNSLSEDKLQTMSISLKVPESEQNNQTWDNFRHLLCNATNMYITTEHINLELCQPDNVTFLDISKCLKSLPNSDQCVQVIFAIPLYAAAEENFAKIEEQPLPISGGFGPKQVHHGMNSSDLHEMWSKYGRSAFKSAGYEQYDFPNTALILGLWVGIVFGVALIFLLIVLTLCRCGLFRDYFSWMTESKDDEAMLQSELSYDHTKIPSPHQVFPEFMPSHPPSYHWDSIYESQNPRFGHENTTSPPDHEDSAILRHGGRQNVAFINDEEGSNSRPDSRSRGHTYIHGAVEEISIT